MHGACEIAPVDWVCGASLAGAADLFQPALGTGRVECAHGATRAFGVRPDPGGHREEIRAGFNQGCAIVDGDTADGDARHLRDIGPPCEDVPTNSAFGGFGACVKECTERNIVRTGLCRLEREVPGIMASHADNCVVPQQSPGVCIGGILLADMDAVAAKFSGEVGPVVQDKRDVVFLGDRQQFTDCTVDFRIRHGCFVGPLEAQLQASDIAGRERGVQRCGKRRQLLRGEIGRADQVEAATEVAASCPVCIGRAQNLP